jgi:small subunit ribosomal protein S16
MGNRNRPFYRIVVSDSRRRPTSEAVEELGYYDAIKQPAVLAVKRDRIAHWVGQGAQMSDTVTQLLKASPAAPAAASN